MSSAEDDERLLTDLCEQYGVSAEKVLKLNAKTASRTRSRHTCSTRPAPMVARWKRRAWASYWRWTWS